jgi:hypothetical protein
MAIVTLTGTVTPLTTLFDATRSNMIGNEPRLEGAKGTAPGGTGLNLETVKRRDGVQLDELRQFIEQIAIATGLLYWPAALLISTLLKAELASHRTGVLLGDAASPSRTYAAV